MSLFGNTQSKAGDLFSGLGSRNPAANQQQTQQSGTSLFGSLPQAQQQPQQTNSLFGGQQAQPAQSASLFGGTAQAQPQQQSTSLFGGQQNQGLGSSLFGGQQNQQAQGSSLFGGTQQGQTSSLFGASQQPQPQQSTGLFGSSQQQQQQPTTSLFGRPQQQLGGSTLGSQTQPQQASRSLWQPGSVTPREKTIPEQMQTLLEKWSPDTSNCMFQHYFYNHVNPETVPYYGPGQGEDEAKWEEALKNKPSEDAIPVLCKGFSALGNRLRIQVQSVSALQARLHEINNSLTAMLQAHDVDISVRANDAKRRHVALSQRTLQLATKIQILRNRGYALDGAEEGLRKKLLDLEKQAFDPRLNGRQEEVWARMVALRDRAQMLKEEADRTQAGLTESHGETLDQDTMKRIRKILSDYDSQIGYLARETESIKRDFEGWERGGQGEKSDGRR